MTTQKPARMAPARGVAITVASVIGIVFAIPMIAMTEFTFRDSNAGGYSFVHWDALFDPANASKFTVLGTGLVNSMILSVVTVLIVLLLLTPTMILIALRLPWMRRPFEFVCLLPISIPAIVVVVGLAPIYQFIGKNFGTGVWSLAFAYGVTVLPFAYRALQANLDAIDVTTLSEAARSLGASWRVVIGRVIVPNIRQGLLASALITIAVVFGEYTIASLLNRQNLQTALVLISQQDPYISIIVSLLTLIFSFVLLLVIGRVATIGAHSRPQKG